MIGHQEFQSLSASLYARVMNGETHTEQPVKISVYGSLGGGRVTRLDLQADLTKYPNLVFLVEIGDRAIAFVRSQDKSHHSTNHIELGGKKAKIETLNEQEYEALIAVGQVATRLLEIDQVNGEKENKKVDQTKATSSQNRVYHQRVDRPVSQAAADATKRHMRLAESAMISKLQEKAAETQREIDREKKEEQKAQDAKNQDIKRDRLKKDTVKEGIQKKEVQEGNLETELQKAEDTEQRHNLGLQKTEDQEQRDYLRETNENIQKD